MIKILIPTPLRKFTGGNSSVEVEASTVSDAIAQLATTFPEVKQHLYDGNDELRRFLRIYVGEEDIQQLEGAGTNVTPGDKISIIPAIAGGSTDKLSWQK